MKIVPIKTLYEITDEECSEHEVLEWLKDGGRLTVKRDRIYLEDRMIGRLCQ
jgi:hypothetical protein